ETAVHGGRTQSAAEPERAAARLPKAELSVSAPPEAQSPGELQFFMESHAQEAAVQETPAHGGQSRSAAEPEKAAAQLPKAELSVSAPPEAQSPGEPQFFMESHAPEAAAPETPVPAPSAPATVAPPPRPAGEQTKPRSLFPKLARTAVAVAVLGFGGILGLRYFGGSRINGFDAGERIAALNARIDAVEGKDEAASAASRTALSAMETRVAAAENAANKAVESAKSAQADAQKAFASREAAQEPAPAPAPTVPDFGPLEARIGTLEQKLAPLESAFAAPKADLRPRQDRADAAAGVGSRALAIAIVAESLLRKLDGGGQFSGELAALENLGVPQASLAPLRAASESTVSSEGQLTARFATLVPGIIASESAKQASADEGILDRLTRNAKGLLHVRRVGDAEAAGVEGYVARIEDALADDDLEAAYKAWKELPGAATSQSASWGEAAKARLDVLNAARSIEADAVAVLGKPKS
ncbi:MAG: hypothetical protein ACREDA_04290, partial [Methylocella sp.]